MDAPVCSSTEQLACLEFKQLALFISQKKDKNSSSLQLNSGTVGRMHGNHCLWLTLNCTVGVPGVHTCTKSMDSCESFPSNIGAWFFL